MQQNRINVTLTGEQKLTILAALEELESAIPFRVSLDSTERRRLLKLGDKSEGFVRTALEAARNHPEHLPANLSLENLARDEALRDILLTLVQRIGALHTQVRDSHLLAGSDLMQGATAIYRALQANARGEGLDDTIGTLKKRWDRPSRSSEPPAAPIS